MSFFLIVGVSLISYVAGYFIGSYQGIRHGYQRGIAEERVMFGVAIGRAFKDNKKESMDSVAREYKRLEVELENRANQEEFNQG